MIGKHRAKLFPLATKMYQLSGMIVFLAVISFAFTCSADRIALFNRKTAPKGWTLVEKAMGTQNVNFLLALKQRNLDVLTQLATQVSDPKSLQYQEYMSVKEITDLVAPSKEIQDRVITVLQQYGVILEDIVNRGDAMDVRTSVEVASKFFETEFFHFQHEDGRAVVRSLGAYSLPEELQDVVVLAAGVSTFPVPHLSAKKHFRDTVEQVQADRRSLRSSAPELNSDYTFVPQSVYQLYDFRNLSFSSALGTSQGVIQFESQNYDDADVTTYSKSVSISILHPSANTTVGTNVQAAPGLEAQLDVESMGTCNNEATMWFWIETGTGWLYSFTSHFFATEDVPQLISISYDWSELDSCQSGVGADDCSALGVNAQQYVDLVNTEFQKIALRGVSVLVASGDSGANGRTNPTCSYDRQNPQLKPDFPACSPWVTSVGGTELANYSPLANAPPICPKEKLGLECAGSGTEVAISYALSGFASGGGFSWYADQPSWQSAAVAKYFAQNATTGALPPAKVFNVNGRGYPDIAAMSHNLLIDYLGFGSFASGTSVSSPIMGAFFSLLNQVSIKKTGKTLGFLNPLIYQMYAEQPSVFTDITVGDNLCTENGCYRSCYGYKTAPGWDAVTGLGSLKYKAAESYVSNLMDAVIARKVAQNRA